MTQMRERVSSGVTGLDEVLHGGFLADRAYLVRGGPGTGKTILGLHFLVAGAQAGEPVLFVSFSEPEASVRSNAATLGLELQDIAFLDMTPSSALFAETQSYDIFSPSEVEREPTARRILDRIAAVKPSRVFLDAVTQLRYLTSDEPEFRRYTFSLLRTLTDQGATVLFTSECGGRLPDDDLQFLSDGVVELHYGAGRRMLSIPKFRGSGHEPDVHAVKIDASGLHVYPRLVPDVHSREFAAEIIPSGVEQLDEMLSGGLERGTVTLLTGPVGAGKTTVGLHFMKEAARRDERSVVYLFEEALATVLHRSAALGIPVAEMNRQGTLSLVPVEPLKLTAEEFAQIVRREVEEQGARIVMLDSTRGYQLSLRGEDLVMHLHALTRYLRNMGVTTLLINETEALIGLPRATEFGFSYLADNILFFTYAEMEGRLRKAVGVLKKRVSGFDDTMRELIIGEGGIRLGPQLRGTESVLLKPGG